MKREQAIRKFIEGSHALVYDVVRVLQQNADERSKQFTQRELERILVLCEIALDHTDEISWESNRALMDKILYEIIEYNKVKRDNIVW